MIITLLTSLLLSSCVKKTEKISTNKTLIKAEMNYDIETTYDDNGMDNKISIITIDSCEYIMTKVYYGHVLTHKGNCTNHIHK